MNKILIATHPLPFFQRLFRGWDKQHGIYVDGENNYHAEIIKIGCEEYKNEVRLPHPFSTDLPVIHD